MTDTRSTGRTKKCANSLSEIDSNGTQGHLWILFIKFPCDRALPSALTCKIFFSGNPFKDNRQTQTSSDKGSHRNSKELSSVVIFWGTVYPYPCRRPEEKRHDDVEEKEEALGVSREGVNMTPFNPVSWEIQGWDPVLGRTIPLGCLGRVEFQDLTGGGVLFQMTAS